MATTHCGCYYSRFNSPQLLPQVHLNAHATILSSTSRTLLTQTFVNPENAPIKEVSYNFPLCDGVTVVGFTCRVGDRVLQGEVQPKEDADANYRKAVSQGQSAGILDHSASVSDVFRIRLGNVAADGQIVVEITFIEELKQDAQSDGIRYTLPSIVAPRYGSTPPDAQVSPSALPAVRRGVSVTVDVAVNKGSVIRGIDSPSHPVKVLLGRTSVSPESSFEAHNASARLHLVADNVVLDRDFVVVVNADGHDKLHALLETHPTIPNQRALMTSLVPKFNIPNDYPEVVFVIDRSGSMQCRIPELRDALKVFLKSLPVGVHFNICSFGSNYTFLWPRSVPYDQQTLAQANDLADSLQANMGGTEMQGAVEAAVKNRLGDTNLEILVLSDGQIWREEVLFSFITGAASENKIRFFSLGIGDSTSTSLIEGIARAGNGFSQFVLNSEELDRKVVRMLKGALTPHIQDYKLDVEYDTADQEYEIVDPVDEAVSTSEGSEKTVSPEPAKKPISLYDSEYKEPTNTIKPLDDSDLPSIPVPDLLQAPTKIPTLYPFIRFTAYILLGPQTAGRTPQSLVLRATSAHGPLVLKIPIQDIGQGEMIHQLASRKAVMDLERGAGWLSDQTGDIGQAKIHRLNVRECQRLGTQFQVSGKYCSFVALEKGQDEQVPEQKTSAVELVKVEDKQPQHGVRFMASSQTVELRRKSQSGGPSLFGGGSQSFGPATSGGGSRSGGPSLFGGGSQSVGPTTPFGGGPQSGGSSLFGRGFQTVRPAPFGGGSQSVGPSLFRGGSQSVGPAAPFGGGSQSGGSSLFGGGPQSVGPALFGGGPRGGSHGSGTSRPGYGTVHSFGASAPAQSPSSGLFGSQATTPQSQGQKSNQAGLFGAWGDALKGGGASSAISENPYTPPMGRFCEARDPPNLVEYSKAETEKNETKAESKVHRIIGLQSFKGFWKWTTELLTAVELNEAEVKEKLSKELPSGNPFPNDDSTVILATMLALAFLERKCAGDKDTWELVQNKAEHWIQNHPHIGTVIGTQETVNKSRQVIDSLFH